MNIGYLDFLRTLPEIEKLYYRPTMFEDVECHYAENGRYIVHVKALQSPRGERPERYVVLKAASFDEAVGTACFNLELKNREPPKPVEWIIAKIREGEWNCDTCGDGCDCPDATRIVTEFADELEKTYHAEVKERDATEKALRTEISELKKHLKTALEVVESIEFGYDDHGVEKTFRPADMSPDVQEWRRILGREDGKEAR